MVNVHRDRKNPRRGSSSSIYFLLVVIVVFSGLFSLVSPPNNVGSITTTTATTKNPSLKTIDPDAESMRLWRLELQENCRHYLKEIHGKNITQDDLNRKALMESEALSKMRIPQPKWVSSSPRQSLLTYPTCDHIFLDLGTNRGDSISCAIDASLDVCSSLFVEHDPTITGAYRISKEFPRLHFNVTDLQVNGKGSQALSLLRLLQKYFENPGMESVCVYGIEGNPYFSKHLHVMQDVIDGIQPRPFQFLHIHTETIVTSQDGPASLFIDQYSEKNHFWGSSILQSMPDIRRTSKHNNGTSIKANIEGITLSTLLRRTLGWTTTEHGGGGTSGGSLLIKMDVEGAEFGILKEVATSNILCEYVRSGKNNATIIVEFHQHLITDPDEKRNALQGLKDAKERLRRCGVKLRNLPDFWT